MSNKDRHDKVKRYTPIGHEVHEIIGTPMVVLGGAVTKKHLLVAKLPRKTPQKQFQKRVNQK